eukprot:261477-Prymnesium_polylepis.1
MRATPCHTAPRPYHSPHPQPPPLTAARPGVARLPYGFLRRALLRLHRHHRHRPRPPRIEHPLPGGRRRQRRPRLCGRARRRVGHRRKGGRVVGHHAARRGPRRRRADRCPQSGRDGLICATGRAMGLGSTESGAGQVRGWSGGLVRGGQCSPTLSGDGPCVRVPPSATCPGPPRPVGLGLLLCA